jgi:response regulator RpfG family c-di-GMP phosphodiesterase
MNSKHRVLVVDDEGYICDIIAEMFHGDSEFAVVTETDPAKALEILQTHQFDLVLTDLVMGDHSGMQMMEVALAQNPEVIVILMTGHPTVENAIKAVKRGAYDYLIKPFKLDLLRATVARGLRKQQLARENVHLKEQLALYRITEAMSSTIHLNTALNQVLRLTIKEFAGHAASILFYDGERDNSFILQALQNQPGVACNQDFLEGKSGHSRLAVQSKDVHIENVYSEPPADQGLFTDQVITSYITCPLLVGGMVLGVLNLQRAGSYHGFTTGELQSLKIIASKAAYAISNSKLYDDLQRAYLATISAFANAVEARDRYTRGHTERVTYLAELIARELGWDEEQLFLLSMGSRLHDIGKIGVPDSILNKPGKLDDKERENMRRHPELGAKMIEGIPFLLPCRPYILSHHERWDGNGYPQGLSGADIPIEGRILAVADTFDAILTNRPYRDAGSLEKAISELREFSGSQFDPTIVEIFLNLLTRHGENINVIYGTTAEVNQLKMELV